MAEGFAKVDGEIVADLCGMDAVADIENTEGIIALISQLKHKNDVKPAALPQVVV
jgi:hypothetical protein